MPNVFDQISNSIDAAQAKADADRKKSLVEYGEIIARSADPEPTDAMRLLKLIAALEITLDDVRADADAIADARRTEARIVPDGVVAEKLAALEKAGKIYQDEAQALLDRERRLAGEQSSAYHLWRSADDGNRVAREQMEQIRRGNPRAFGIDPAPVTVKQTAPPVSANCTTVELPFVKPSGLAPSTGPTERDMVTAGRIGGVL